MTLHKKLRYNFCSINAPTLSLSNPLIEIYNLPTPTSVRILLQIITNFFFFQVVSLKDDITTLSEAHLVARERNKTLESQIEKERAEKLIIKDKIKVTC